MSKIVGKVLPPWDTLDLYEHPQIAINCYLLDWDAAQDRYKVRFSGNALSENSGVEVTGQWLDEISDANQYAQWDQVNRFARENVAMASVEFDLGFVEREYRKVCVTVLPLGPMDPVRKLMGYYIWES